MENKQSILEATRKLPESLAEAFEHLEQRLRAQEVKVHKKGNKSWYRIPIQRNTNGEGKVKKNTEREYVGLVMIVPGGAKK